eukprot:gnl/TRDRNA2_/TRDRNA2_121103_c0_seq1.p1 gnl/TRDRNA2_/TRDRNA2_121103_c0~~gnl/TRDRNA2_/TRDRNA2_121103_c0_seq1.p1  ORF type:complete len:457 (+),score=78.01 gnl/TRDRNA2_/TRDRNA2_121103_c0_seq1:181-1371(+)
MAVRQFAVAPTATTTTTAPPNEVLRVDGVQGYPPWMINDMIALDQKHPDEISKEEEEARMAQMIASEEVLRERAERAARENAKLADGSTGLPQSSKDLLVDDTAAILESSSSEFNADGTVNVTSDEDQVSWLNPPCRTISINSVGEVVGQIIGDCVQINSTLPFKNAVEMCVPVTYTNFMSNVTDLVDREGVVLDFAMKEVVPEYYNTSTTEILDDDLRQIPGRLAGPLSELEVNDLFGRLMTGWAKFTPLGLRAELRKHNTRLCAKVFQPGWTYCPIARLKTNPYMPIPWHKMLPLDSSCPALDNMLVQVQSMQKEKGWTRVPYRRVDMSMHSNELMEQWLLYREEQARKRSPVSSLHCDTGRDRPIHCIGFHEGGFRTAQETSGFADGSCPMSC